MLNGIACKIHKYKLATVKKSGIDKTLSTLRQWRMQRQGKNKHKATIQPNELKQRGI